MIVPTPRVTDPPKRTPRKKRSQKLGVTREVGGSGPPRPPQWLRPWSECLVSESRPIFIVSKSYTIILKHPVLHSCYTMYDIYSAINCNIYHIR